MNNENIPLSANISVESLGFTTFSKSYLYLVDELISRNMVPELAAEAALNLASNYLNFACGSKIAEANSGNIAFIQEDDG